MSFLQFLKVTMPVAKRALFTGQIFNPACVLVEPDKDILCEYEVKIPMKDGFSLTANIFRSKSADLNNEKLPVIMCAHPYDNSLTPALGNTPLNGPPKQYRILPQAGKPSFSTLTSWESPDPNYWVPNGYAVVNLNMPGMAASEGPLTVSAKVQSKCFYEAIEWIAQRDWCSGSIGLSGVSFLAISQYFVATCEAYGGPPPSLKAISPWEGMADMYRELACEGGVAEIGFPSFWFQTEIKPVINGTLKEFLEKEGHPNDWLNEHPLFDDFWAARSAPLHKINLPILVCAAFADQGLHSIGSFRAFNEAVSKEKWVYTHRWGKWDSYYSREVQDLTKRFMDRFVKGEQNGFEKLPPVRLEVRSSRDVIHEIRHETQWPLANTNYRKLYLNGSSGRLQSTLPEYHENSYNGQNGSLTYSYTFDKDTELTGYMKLHLAVEVRAGAISDPIPDDMIICTAVNKRDTEGNEVRFYGCVGNKQDMVARGFLRVSRRELDGELSTDEIPVLSGTSELKLSPSEIVTVDIRLWPSSTFFKKGEQLELILSAKEIIPSYPFKKNTSSNCGVHVFHTGRDNESYLQIPEIV